MTLKIGDTLPLSGHPRGKENWPLNRVSSEISQRCGRNVNLLEYLHSTVAHNTTSGVIHKLKVSISF